ncbi:hypothetical protein SEUCBS139899_003854, partial [Sporothrix eucalyptigena]
MAYDMLNVTTPRLAFRQQFPNFNGNRYDERYSYEWYNVPPHLVGKDHDTDGHAEVL